MSDPRVTTYVKTAATRRVIPLAEAKLHCKIDDYTAGTKASVSVGTGNSTLVLTAKFVGEYANDWTLAVVISGDDTPLSVVRAGDAFTVNLATSELGAATSTVNDVIAAIAADANLSALVTVSDGAGNGTGIMAAAGATDFTGGVEGQSDDDDLLQLMIAAAEKRAETILRLSLLTQTLVRLEDQFPFEKRHMNLDQGPVQSVTHVKYFDASDELQTLSTDDYSTDIRSIPQVVVLEPAATWPSTKCFRRNAVQIEYVTGWASPADVPDEIKHALRFIISHFYRNRDAFTKEGLVELPNGARWLLDSCRDYRF